MQGLDQKEAESYSYSAFGEKKIYDNSNQEIGVSCVSNPWQYLSKRLDEETNLVFFGRRYYDPEIGRWLTPDPKGFEDGLNLYAYVLNDPLTRLDLYGLEINNNDFSKVQFPNAEQSLFSNFNLNFNLNFDTYWKWLLFMKMQNMEVQSFQKDSFLSNSFDEVKNIGYNVGDFVAHLGIGIAEGATGINIPYLPFTKAGMKGRMYGRDGVNLYGKASTALMLFFMGKNLFSGDPGPVLALAGGAGITTAATALASPYVIIGGTAVIITGYVLHRNQDKLTSLERPDGKGGVNIYPGDQKEGLKHIMIRHKFNTQELNVSKFNKGMGKYEIKRLIQKGWKRQPKKYIKTTGGYQEWNITMSKPIGFGQHGQKTKMLKVIVEENSRKIITAYPF